MTDERNDALWREVRDVVGNDAVTVVAALQDLDERLRKVEERTERLVGILEQLTTTVQTINRVLDSRK